MKADTNNISRELREDLENASTGLHSFIALQGHKVTDSPAGTDAVWVELRHREFDMTPTLAHILAARHTRHYRQESRSRE